MSDVTARWFARPDRGLIEVRGSDRESWLNGMISNELPPAAGGAAHAAILTPKGRVVADLYVVRAADDLWLELERAFVAPTIAHLERYVIADDVTLVDRSEEFVQRTVEGADAPEVLARAIPALASDALPDRGEVVRVAFEESEVVLAAHGFGVPQAFQLFAAAELATRLAATLGDAGAQEGSMDALERLRVELGVPRLGRELDDGVLPDEARLEDAISTTKGCYTGQEIVARLRSRAQVNHLLVGLRLDAKLESESATGELVIEVGDKRSGEVTSIAASPAFGSIALGFVRREHASEGQPVTLVGQGLRSSATIAMLPFGTAETSEAPAPE